MTVGGLTAVRNGSTYQGGAAAQTFGGGLALDRGTVSGANLTVAGDLTAGADSAGASTVTGGLSLGGTRTITVADADDTLVVAAAVGGGGVVKGGAGVLRLDGANTYAGPTTVQSGTLLVGGAVPGPVALTGGVLGGTGTVGAVTASRRHARARGRRGRALGTGNLTLAAATTVVAELGGAASTRSPCKGPSTSAGRR